MPKIKAFFFDQDGVIIDTEKDGHRVAFNETFKAFGLDAEWSVEDYHSLLQVGGGKERMRHYHHTKGFGIELTPEAEESFIKKLHQYKTDTFIRLLESNKLPLRPGIRRIMQEINEMGLVLAVTTTSNQRAAQAVATKILPEIHFDFILAGDVVKVKKPNPEIYLMAMERAGLKPEECLVIEDSRNGVAAAHAAGIRVIATTNFYTEKEDLSLADIVVTCLGDPDGEKGVLKSGGEGLKYDGVLTARQLVDYFLS
ncbi:MAG: HAD-IA family hydrolase [Anaerolineaceae bacterium]|nr:HAD-IA family hydrolase [Anaerolineaceae bacterium]